MLKSCFNQLRSRKTCHWFQMLSWVLEILASITQTTEGLPIPNMFNLLSDCRVLIDKILKKAFLGVVYLAWHIRLWIGIAQPDKTIHASLKASSSWCCLALAWQDICRRGRGSGNSKALQCDEKWNDYKQGMEEKCDQVSLKYNPDYIEWWQKLRTVACNSQPGTDDLWT